MASTDTTSHSRDVILGYGTVVRHADYGTGIIDYEGWNEADGDYAFVLFYEGISIKAPLAAVRPITFWRWQLWRDPRGGFRRHRHGGNWAVFAMFAYAFFIWAIYDNAREFNATHDPWHLGVVVFSALTICGIQFWNWRNWYHMVTRNRRK